jgi:DNA repair exonuclease SbcCD nuclease subunit
MRQITHDNPIRILHTADLHIGSGMAVGRRVGREEDLTAATWHALDNIIDLALEEEVDLVTIGGDVFDRVDQHNPLPRMKLKKGLKKLGEIPVALVRGNHDHLSPSVAAIDWPENVKELSKDDPTLDLGRICVHGISYHREKQKNDLVPKYPDPVDDCVNIGLLHANVGGQQGHDPYAPTDVDTLSAKGYQAWLLGHIHQRKVLAENPLILYPGNIQGRDAGEMGPRTVELVTITEEGVATTETRQVHAVLWEQIEFDLSEVTDVDTLLNLIDDGIDDAKAALDSERGLVLRLRLFGASELHELLSGNQGDQKITEIVQEHVHDGHASDDPFVLINKVFVKTTMKLDIAKLCQDKDNVLGVIARMLDDDDISSEALAELREVGINIPKSVNLKEMWQDAVHGALGRIRGRTD